MDHFCSLSEIGTVLPIIDLALAEDLAAGDVTSRALVQEHLRGRAKIIAKCDLTMCGGDVCRQVFARVDPKIKVDVPIKDGEQVSAKTTLAVIEGPARSILAGERTALNFLSRMCGVASLTQAFVKAVEGRCKIVDTRKTMPGHRALDRYAVRCGGGFNHRNDLGSGVLIKENHIRCSGGIKAAIERARKYASHSSKIECEVENLSQLEEALEVGADVIMLDNMDDESIKTAVLRTKKAALIEVSGGIGIKRAGEISTLGVDFISIGALTHSAPVSDLSLLFMETM